MLRYNDTYSLRKKQESETPSLPPPPLKSQPLAMRVNDTRRGTPATPARA